MCGGFLLNFSSSTCCGTCVIFLSSVAIRIRTYCNFRPFPSASFLLNWWLPFLCRVTGIVDTQNFMFSSFVRSKELLWDHPLTLLLHLDLPHAELRHMHQYRLLHFSFLALGIVLNLTRGQSPLQFG